MFLFPDFSATEIIQENEKTIVYRGYHSRDRQKVIIKLLKTEYLNQKDITLFENDYLISKKLNLAGILQVEKLEKSHNSSALIFEDFFGNTLLDYLKNHEIKIIVFLVIAIKISSILATIHNKHIIYKNLSSHNIWIDPITQNIKIYDFSLSSFFNEKNNNKIPQYLPENLGYISPEQTGRINRDIDYRTTFYSLGVVFYEMLTGSLPFLEKETMELIHSHIAKQPVAPHQLNPEIPMVISNIIIKLLSKNPEARYQSAYGLKFDLEKCLADWKSRNIIKQFVLGKKDRNNHLIVSHQLYEREEAINQIVESYQRISQGTTEICLISGKSGVGKTALVDEFKEIIFTKKCYFISGKFSTLGQKTPYFAVIQAFQDLVQQLLTENERNLELWKQLLLNRLGFDYSFIVDLIPKLELISGKKTSISSFTIAEYEKRFKQILQKFVSIFTQKNHPLILFFDDLQWADIDSLELIELLLTQSELKYLLVIGSFRDDEVEEQHPLNLMLNKIKNSRLKINQIFLKSLKLDSVRHLIADSFRYELFLVEDLSKLIFQKTNGNPFFINQVLQELYNYNLLYFDYNQGKWTWKTQDIAQINVTENVADFLINKINNLSIPIQDVLKNAACIGNFFDINLLSLLTQKTISETSLILDKAIQEGLLSFTSNCPSIHQKYSQNELDSCYFFVHDKIQQAAYSLLVINEKELMHLKIGKIMMKKIYTNKINDNIFEIVNQFNSGIKAITQEKELIELAKLNFIAGKKAKSKTAYESAFKYLEKAQLILSQDTNIWDKHYDIILNTNLELSECQYLRGNFEEAETIFDIILQQAKTNIEKAQVYILKINLYTDEVKLQQAIDIGLEAAELFNVYLPEKDFQLVVDREINQIQKQLGDREIKSLANLPKMADDNAIALMKIFMSLAASTYFINLDLWTLLMLKMINLSLKYGNNEVSSFAYSAYGLMLGSAFGNYQAGYEFGKLALDVNQKFNNIALNSKVYFMFGAFINHWKNHISSDFDYLEKSFKFGKETGDPSFSSYASNVMVSEMYLKGDNLDYILQKSQEYITHVNKVKNIQGIYFQIILRQMILSLKGITLEALVWNTESFNEKKYLAKVKDLNLGLSIHFYYILKLQSCFLFEDYAQAQEMAIESEKMMVSSFGLLRTVEHYFYYCLALIALSNHSQNTANPEVWKLVDNYQEKLKQWSQACPENFLHKYLLVAAEIARSCDRDLLAMELYDRSIASAQENDYTQNEAIANELAAKFYLSKGKNKIARFYMMDACYGYEKWGATAKVKDLQQKYSQLFLEHSPKITKNPALSLDLFTVIKASQTLSGEIMLDKLLEKLMKALIENAGAEKGFLILEKDPEWVIEAEGQINCDEVNILRSISINHIDENQPILPVTIINYIIHTQETIVLNNASSKGQFTADPYIIANKSKSILCTPLLNQGKIIGLLYLENNLTTNAFSSDRIEILRILSAQAAISIENARLYGQLENYNRNLELKVKERTHELSQTLEILKATQAELIFENELLKNTDQPSTFDYQVGGSLPMNAPTYVVRSADRNLHKALQQGEFCYVLNPRQMGKSSLMVKMMHHLQHDGINCGVIDLTRIGSENITPEQWYKGLIVELWRSFGLLRKVNFKNWWNELEGVSPVQKLSQFIEEILLVEVGEKDNADKVVIFIDEIDSILGLNFAVNDFFALIRSCYNQRSINPEYKRLTFALFGVATPGDLITDHQITPFNIGTTIQLEGFKEHEAQPLLQGLTQKVSNPQTVLKEVLAWTNGQPFLTQKICKLIRNASSPIPPNQEAEWIENLIKTHVIENWESQDEPEHLRTIRDRLLKSKQSDKLLKLYRQILQQGEIASTDLPEERELVLSGLIIKQQETLKVHNRIYQSIFI